MFHNCKTTEEAKKLFRKLCLLLHPDKGGSNELMVLLNEAYELFLKPKGFRFASEGEEQKKASDKVFKGDERLNILEELFDLQEEYDFKSDYFDSVLAFLEARKYITTKQLEGLEGVLKNWSSRAK